MIRMPGGIAVRIALAAFIVAGVATVILAVGVMLVGGQSFAELMAQHGTDTASSRAMFEDAVGWVLAAAIVVALVVAIVVASVLGARLARPLRAVGLGARRIADGHYDARIPREGPEEIVSLADSFNQMAAALEEQERMRREFIANAAHELRTPLTNLQGYLEALRDGVIQPDRSTFESLLEEAERLVRLSRSLDTLTTGDAPTTSTDVAFDVADAIWTAVDLARPSMLAAELTLDTDVPAQLPAHGDPDRFAQVVGNLLQNAIRYTPPGGQVGVVAERRPNDILVSVTNSGDGIPPDDLPRVFERFYRVEKSRDRARGGAGIGLAIVRELVEAAGGAVGAESRGGLTRFWFTLPSA
jgi:two-component system, OmpR family, sensor histidine kinase BaeS